MEIIDLTSEEASTPLDVDSASAIPAFPIALSQIWSVREILQIDNLKVEQGGYRSKGGQCVGISERTGDRCRAVIPEKSFIAATKLFKKLGGLLAYDPHLNTKLEQLAKYQLCSKHKRIESQRKDVLEKWKQQIKDATGINTSATSTDKHGDVHLFTLSLIPPPSPTRNFQKLLEIGSPVPVVQAKRRRLISSGFRCVANYESENGRCTNVLSTAGTNKAMRIFRDMQKIIPLDLQNPEVDSNLRQLLECLLCKPHHSKSNRQREKTMETWRGKIRGAVLEQSGAEVWGMEHDPATWGLVFDDEDKWAKEALKSCT